MADRIRPAASVSDVPIIDLIFEKDCNRPQKKDNFFFQKEIVPESPLGATNLACGISSPRNIKASRIKRAGSVVELGDGSGYKSTNSYHT